METLYKRRDKFGGFISEHKCIDLFSFFALLPPPPPLSCFSSIFFNMFVHSQNFLFCEATFLFLGRLCYNIIWKGGSLQFGPFSQKWEFPTTCRYLGVRQRNREAILTTSKSVFGRVEGEGNNSTK